MADPDAYTTFDTPYNFMSVMHYSRFGIIFSYFHFLIIWIIKLIKWWFRNWQKQAYHSHKRSFLSKFDWSTSFLYFRRYWQYQLALLIQSGFATKKRNLKYSMSKNSPEWPFLAFSKNNFNFTVFLFLQRKQFVCFEPYFVFIECATKKAIERSF